MKLNLKERGKQTITRDDGDAVHKLIRDAWDKESKIEVDFDNIVVASVSFFDEAFGRLAFDYPKEVLTEKLTFVNMDEYDRALLNDIMLSRYRQKAKKMNGHSRSKPERRVKRKDN